MKSLIIVGFLLMMIGLSSSISSDTSSPLRTKNVKRIEAFKPKFVKILTADEIKQSNVKSTEKRKPIVHQQDIGSNYGLLQNVYTVEEIPKNQIKATVHSEPYKGPKLRPAPGAYPVYYSGAFVNGKFGKSIRAFTADEFEKQNFL